MKGYTTLISSLFFLISYSQVSVVHFNSEWNKENNYDYERYYKKSFR